MDDSSGDEYDDDSGHGGANETTAGLVPGPCQLVDYLSTAKMCVIIFPLPFFS